MKNIFKKNHIIITALAIMIVIAGYLSFTNNDTADDGNVVETEAVDNGDYEEFTGVEGLDVATTTDTDTDTTDTNTTDTDTANEEDTLDTTADETDDPAAEAETTADENEETDEADKSNELGDISDEDLLTVADNGKLNLEEGVPGEAVLANAASTIDSSYFITNKIEREQVRAKSRAAYMDIIDSAEVSEEQKQVVIDGMLELTNIMAQENKAEMLLEAKGFDGAIVFIADGMVDVVVNAEALTDQQLAIIEEVVKDNTGIAVENIDINPVVVSE